MSLNWPRAHGEALFEAGLKQAPEDFRVRERLGFAPAGRGEHDLLHIEKTNTNTQWLARRLARHAGVPARDVGFCGLKDRNAVTSQWFSVRRPSGAGTDWASFDVGQVRLLAIERHDRKLRPGSHSANAFVVRLRASALPERAVIDERLNRIGTDGVPNYFGTQRFGFGGANLATAERLFAGARLKRDERSIALSAARGYLFNEILGRRVADGTWNRILPGELANLAGSASVFVVEDVDEMLTERCDQQDIHPTATLWGDGAPCSSGDVAELERDVASSHGMLAEGLKSLRVGASSRATRLCPVSLEWQIDSDGIVLGFELGTGSYATTLIRELAATAEQQRGAR